MTFLSLPYPPSINHYWGRNGTRNFLTDKALAFRLEVLAAFNKTGPRKRILLGPLTIAITLHPPDYRKRDIDNPIKGLLDSLQHARVFGDDSQIVRLEIDRLMPDPKNPRCIVRVELI
jgi:crossover junction endodeoxyribonuclease RusA